MNWKIFGIILLILWGLGTTGYILYSFVGVPGSAIAITALIFLILVMGFVIFNLYKKMKILETWTETFISRVAYVDEELERIDADGAFEADDEVGFVFREIKKIIKLLTDLTDAGTGELDASQEEK